MLVATDIAARGIDVEALGHVVNFDVPAVPEDYIHRVGRTARAEATGDAFTFVAPEEEDDLRAIERAIGKRLPRVTLPDFDYKAQPAAKLEVPIAERIAAIRARKAEERARARGNAERRARGARPAPSAATPSESRPATPSGPGGVAAGDRAFRGRGLHAPRHPPHVSPLPHHLRERVRVRGHQRVGVHWISIEDRLTARSCTREYLPMNSVDQARERRAGSLAAAEQPLGSPHPNPLPEAMRERRFRVRERG